MSGVYLVGFMGCGKSTVGAELARQRRVPFIDMDQVLERAFACSVAAFFERHGEEEFRAREADLLHQIAERGQRSSGDAAVVATGGGCFCFDRNRETIGRSGGQSIYLCVPWAVLEQRLASDAGERPLLRDAESARRLLLRREPLYRKASMTLELEGLEAVGEVVERVLEMIPEVQCAT